jgi:hypothetical protein
MVQDAAHALPVRERHRSLHEAFRQLSLLQGQFKQAIYHLEKWAALQMSERPVWSSVTVSAVQYKLY